MVRFQRLCCVWIVGNHTNGRRAIKVNLNTISIVELEIIKTEQIIHGMGMGFISDFSLNKETTNKLIKILPDFYSDLDIKALFLTKNNYSEVTKDIVLEVKSFFLTARQGET
jgi:DNA repair photolyase